MGVGGQGGSGLVFSGCGFTRYKRMLRTHQSTRSICKHMKPSVSRTVILHVSPVTTEVGPSWYSAPELDRIWGIW